jgi:hypothetical protein
VLKLAANLTILITNRAFCEQDAVLQTLVTIGLAEGLMSLQNLILERDAYALDKRSKQNLQQHLLKFAKAA